MLRSYYHFLFTSMVSWSFQYNPPQQDGPKQRPMATGVAKGVAMGGAIDLLCLIMHDKITIQPQPQPPPGKQKNATFRITFLDVYYKK